MFVATEAMEDPMAVRFPVDGDRISSLSVGNNPPLAVLAQDREVTLYKRN